jgi:dienelactone hydrolase
MGVESHFSHDPSEPLAGIRRAMAPPGDYADLSAFRFEYSSRGDRVSGRLLEPGDREGPFPLVILQHGIGGSKSSEYLDAAAGPWVRRGCAVASVDFPLHGDRASDKLTERLLETLRNPTRANPEATVLACEFFHQAVVDLQRAVSLLQELPDIDAKRVAYAGFSLGSIVGATFCSIDPRPCAAAVALGGGGVGPADIDPACPVGRFAPRPVLFVNTEQDEVISRASAEALHAGAGEPKAVLWFEGSHTRLPGAALKAMWQFLSRHLGID